MTTRHWLWIAFLGGMLAPRPAATVDFVIEPLFIAGGRGSSVGDFGVPESVAIDSAGRIVVTDKGRMMLHVYASDDGRPLFDVGHLGSGALEFNRPNGIVVDQLGRILVVEQINRRVHVLDPDYGYAGTFGSGGGGPGEFQKAMGIALDSQNRIYVTDEGRGDVQVFDAGGTFLWSFAKRNPRLDRVESIEVDEARQRILVCDEGKARVNLYDLEGRYLESFGGQGTGPGEFGNVPNAVRVDERGRIYINDQGNSRINVYRSDTRFLASFYNAAGGMQSADGVALSKAHNLFLVADQGNDRVLAFDLGRMKLLLDTAEEDSLATAVHALRLQATALDGSPSTDVYADTRLTFEVRGQGDPTYADAAWIRVYSQQDRHGLNVRLRETGLDTGRFVGQLQLGPTTLAATGPGIPVLGVAEGDTVRAHLPGRDDSLVVGLQPLPPIAAAAFTIEGEDSPDWLPTRTPRLAWRASGTSAARPQTAFEVRLTDANGTPLWTSGWRSSADSTWTYDGPPGITGRWLHVALRLASGRAVSPWRETSMRLNTPPAAPRRQVPAPGAILDAWPPTLRVDLEPEADGQALRAWMELDVGSGATFRSPVVSPVPLGLEWIPSQVLADENGTVRWRVVQDDGIESRSGPWWSLALDARDDPPTPIDLQAPEPGAWISGSVILFRWTGGLDPDPGSSTTAWLEYRAAGSTTWHAETATAAQAHAWKQPVPDGDLEWRVRVRDRTGNERRSEQRVVHLRRNWNLKLRAHDPDGGVSEELVIGARLGASDAFVTGEDVEAPDNPYNPQLLLEDEAPRRASRLVDLREPFELTPSKQPFRVVLRARGRPDTRLRIDLDRSDFPAFWEVRIEDPWQRPLLPPGGDAFSVLLDAAGERALTLTLVAGGAVEGTPLGHRAQNVVDEVFETRPEAMPFRLRELQLANPVHPRGVFFVNRSRTDPIEVRLYDVRGRRRLAWRVAPGASTQFAGTRTGSRRLPPGLYFAHLRMGRESRTEKILWMPERPGSR